MLLAISTGAAVNLPKFDTVYIMPERTAANEISSHCGVGNLLRETGLALMQTAMECLNQHPVRRNLAGNRPNRGC